MLASNSDKERAKQIIVEIVRQAGGSLDNKTNLYKAFYFAHLRFAEMNPGYLSSWPIVRMPRGPGIHNAGSLLDELRDQVAVSPVLKGDRIGCRFILSADAAPSTLSEKEIEAISYGVKHVICRSAANVSHKSHRISRSWNEAQSGAELNVYADLLSEDEFRAKQEKMRRLRAAYNEPRR
jgi:hypothetical protein